MDENHILLLEGVEEHIEYIHYFESVLNITTLNSPYHLFIPNAIINKEANPLSVSQIGVI